MNSSEQIDKLAAALSKAQSVLKGAKADSTNPFFKSSYADLESVWDAIRGPLTDNGLSVTQTTDVTEFGPVLVTTLIHSSGQWISGRYPLISAKPNDPQALGSATSYARRYTLAAIMGVYQSDDDAEKAVSRETKPVDKSTCTHRWLKSKFDKTEEWCTLCKAKRKIGPAPVANGQDNHATEDIPF